jgi:hypothetical protein
LRRRILLAVVLVSVGLVGLATATLVLPGQASAHQSGCHSAHSCPSDHHTYIWYDPGTGLGWDCAEPGAREYDPSQDTTVIVWQGLTYYCRAAGSTGTPTITTTPPPTTPTGSSPVCTAVGGLPDRGCTPGASFAHVTAKQVCTRGYSARVRHVPASVKRAVYARYGIASHSPGEYEVDHLVSLELGGSNAIRTLWPEAAVPRPGFHEKDKVENYLHRRVCHGTMTLRTAQRLIAGNWLRVYANLSP